MTSREAATFLQSLPREQKLRFLAGLCHDVTIAGRFSYDQANGVAEPRALRALNELQHYLTDVLASCLEDPDTEFPDDDVAAIFCVERTPSNLHRLLARFFESAVKRIESPAASSS
jgi:hypothetical protein